MTRIGPAKVIWVVSWKEDEFLQLIFGKDRLIVKQLWESNKQSCLTRTCGLKWSLSQVPLVYNGSRTHAMAQGS